MHMKGFMSADTGLFFTRPQGIVNDIILDPKNAGLLAVCKAARNGAVYGAKVRFPHAFV